MEKQKCLLLGVVDEGKAKSAMEIADDGKFCEEKEILISMVRGSEETWVRKLLLLEGEEQGNQPLLL